MFKIKDFSPRKYQEVIAKTAADYNTLIILPTGLGKTKTAILAAIDRLNSHPDTQILFLTPTKPLSSQIRKEFIKNTDIEEASFYEKQSQYPRIIALTASPGGSREKINEICKNLFIEKVEIRDEHHEEVSE